MPDAKSDKRELRKRVNAALRAVSEPQWGAWCAPLQERLLAREGLRAAAGVMGFVGIPAWREFEMTGTLHALLTDRKRVALPRTERTALTGTTAMASWIQDWQADVVVDPGSSFGGAMRGPRIGLPEAHPEDLDAVIVPGLAFDAQGRRLGRGGGYYDRFLSRLCPSSWKIAVAFECQILASGEIPAESHDQGVHAIVTERRVIEVSRPG